MKRLLKRLLKPLWARTLPLRVRLVARLDQVIHDATCRAIAAHDPTPAITADIARRFDGLAARHAEVLEQFEEVTLALDALIAEQFRLQSQVDSLERHIQDAPALAPEA